MPRLVCISDTHLRHAIDIPDGRGTDVLVHAGDLTLTGTLGELNHALAWLGDVKKTCHYKDVVVIAGNHDWIAQNEPALVKQLMTAAGLTYLDHSTAVIQGLAFFGSPYTPEFCDWAFNVPRGPALARLWSQIPEDTEVLVTHGPPKGRFDTVSETDNADGLQFGSFGRDFRYVKRHVGCADLRDRLPQLKKLRAHIFGHIHKPGLVVGADGITYVNAATSRLDMAVGDYVAAYQPVVIDL